MNQCLHFILFFLPFGCE